MILEFYVRQKMDSFRKKNCILTASQFLFLIHLHLPRACLLKKNGLTESIAK